MGEEPAVLFVLSLYDVGNQSKSVALRRAIQVASSRYEIGTGMRGKVTVRGGLEEEEEEVEGEVGDNDNI